MSMPWRRRTSAMIADVLRVLVDEQPVSLLDQGHRAAQPTERLGELAADRAAADDGQ
jgi:hypothetical protein